MRQSQLIIKALKQSLKARSLTYDDLARHLGISETSVKRVFSEGTFTLERLDQTCQYLGMDFYELAKMASAKTGDETATFSEVQERALAEKPPLFAFFYLLLTGNTPEIISKKYNYQSHDVTKNLLQLDKLKLIELGEKNKFRMLASKNIRWIKDGPLNSLYSNKIKREFLESEFTGPFERLRLLNGYLSEMSLKALAKKIDKLIGEFVETSDIDSSLGTTDGKRIWFMLAYRPWSFSIVRKLKR